jgi:hypothetical protein
MREYLKLVLKKKKDLQSAHELFFYETEHCLPENLEYVFTMKLKTTYKPVKTDFLENLKIKEKIEIVFNKYNRHIYFIFKVFPDFNDFKIIEKFAEKYLGYFDKNTFTLLTFSKLFEQLTIVF